MLFLFCVALWLLLHGVSTGSYHAPCSKLFLVMFSIAITSHGEERAGLYVSRMCYFLFSSS